MNAGSGTAVVPGSEEKVPEPPEALNGRQRDGNVRLAVIVPVAKSGTGPAGGIDIPKNKLSAAPGAETVAVLPPVDGVHSCRALRLWKD